MEGQKLIQVALTLVVIGLVIGFFLPTVIDALTDMVDDAQGQPQYALLDEDIAIAHAFNTSDPEWTEYVQFTWQGNNITINYNGFSASMGNSSVAFDFWEEGSYTPIPDPEAGGPFTYIFSEGVGDNVLFYVEYEEGFALEMYVELVSWDEPDGTADIEIAIYELEYPDSWPTHLISLLGLVPLIVMLVGLFTLILISREVL